MNEVYSNPTNIFDLKSKYFSKLIKVAGIIVAPNKIKIQCRSCGDITPNFKRDIHYPLLRKFNMEQTKRPKCNFDPFLSYQTNSNVSRC